MGNHHSHSKSPTVLTACRHDSHHQRTAKKGCKPWVISGSYQPAMRELPGCTSLLVHTASRDDSNLSQGPATDDHCARCGQPLSGFTGRPEIVGTLVTQLTSLSGGAVIWELDVKKVFHAADASRSPCGANTRLATPSFSLPASEGCLHKQPVAAFAGAPSAYDGPDTPSSCDVGAQGSHPVGISGDDAWHLEWALFDHSDRCVSLYLCHTRTADAATAGDDTAGSGDKSAAAVSAAESSNLGFANHDHEHVLLSWFVTVEGYEDNAQQPVMRKEAHVPTHDYALQRGDGSPSSSCWGVEGLLSLSDLDALTATHTLRVTVRLESQQDSSVSCKSSETCDNPSVVPDAAAAPMSPPAAPHHHHHHPQGGDVSVERRSRLSALRPMLACLSPRILVIDNFLPAQTCREMIELATPRLVRSRVSTGTETPSRLSNGTFFTGASATLPLIQSVEERIQQLITHPAVIKGKKPLTKSEALQVVHYSKGGFYHGHFDNRAGGPVTRHVTIIVYLQDCEAGGATFFPRATAPPTDQELSHVHSPQQLADKTLELHEDSRVSRPGVTILPATGRAVLFWSALPNGEEDLASLHEAERVDNGDKWIATRWFKEVDETEGT